MKHRVITSILGIGVVATLVALNPVRVGPVQAYPNPQYGTGLVATSDFKELTTTMSCGTYSQCHRKTTSGMKTDICKEYVENCKTKVEIDHIVPLALGGADEVKNLWAEPEHLIVGGFDYGFHTKDRLESFLVLQMKEGKISPKDAQNCIISDWVACYQKYLSAQLGGSSVPDPDDQ